MRRYLFSFFVLTIFLFQASGVLAQDKLLTVEDIYHPTKKVNFNGTVPNIRWLKDGKHYLQSNEASRTDVPRLQRVDAVSGTAVPFLDTARLQAALKALDISDKDATQLANRGFYELSHDENALLINWNNDLFYYRLGDNKALRVTTNPDEEVGETFSPDDRQLAYVRNNDMYVYDLAAKAERRLTKDGGPKILNGRLDWVYQEELYGRGNFEAYWWSPDSTKLAYLRFDENPVSEFVVVDHIPYPQTLETTAYPRAGDPNPLVQLGVVKAAGGVTQWIDTSKYTPTDFLVVRVSWTPDSSKVAYQAQNREQSFLDFNFGNSNDGKSVTAFREESKTWVEVIDNPTWLKDGSFLWLSARNGWTHLYHYDPTGKLLRQITDGKWEIRSLDGFDEANGLAYFSATEHSHIAPQTYRVKIDGTGFTRLTITEGTHKALVDPTSTYFIDSWSDINTPTQMRLHDSNGKLVRVLAENKVDALKQYKLGAAELLTVKTRDGCEMEAMMIKPPDFDPKKKYPVLEFTYSGPHSPSVKNVWGGTSYMWHQLMAQKGYIIWICDNRTASGKGVESEWPLFREFGRLELRDLQDGVAWLKTQPYVDGDRIGLWGWSYGGFMTSYALTHSDTYKIGIAGGTVGDQRTYDTIYTERYLQTPQRNPEGYKNSSPRFFAKDLHGKLLLIHGAMDDNVHVQNTIQFAYELQKAGKPFQLMLYPKSRHGVTDPLLLTHMRQMMTDFVLTNL